MKSKAVPKKFLEVDNKPIILHTNRCVRKYIMKIHNIDLMNTLVKKFNLTKVKMAVEGEYRVVENVFERKE